MKMFGWRGWRGLIVGVVLGAGIAGGWAEDQVTGIAARIAKEGEVLRIVNVIPGGPAEAAGLIDADEILLIDGEPIGERSLEELAEMLRGKAFTTVELVVRRDGGELPVTYRVMRKVFTVPEGQFVAP